MNDSPQDPNTDPPPAQKDGGDGGLSPIEVAKLTSSLLQGCPIIEGNEGAMTRRKWASHLKHVVKFWPIQDCSTELLFNHALSGQAWRDYSAMARPFSHEDKNYDGNIEHGFAMDVIHAFQNVPSLPDFDILTQINSLAQGPIITSAVELDARYNMIMDEASRFNFDAEWRDKYVLSALLACLPETLSRNLRTIGVKSPSEARDAARRTLPQTDTIKEDDRSIAAAIVPEPSVMQPAPAAEAVIFSDQAAATIRKQQEDLDMLRREIESLKVTGHGNSQGGKAFQGKKGKPQKVNAIMQTQGQRPKNNLQIACQICGRTNHSAVDCCDPRNPAAEQNRVRLGRQRPYYPEQQMANPQQQRPSGMSCQLCGGGDHLATACSRQGGSRQKQFNCFNCGQEGHTSRFCKNPRRGSTGGANCPAPTPGPSMPAAPAPYFPYGQYPPYPYSPMAHQYPPPPWMGNTPQYPMGMHPPALQNSAQKSASQMGNR